MHCPPDRNWETSDEEQGPLAFDKSLKPTTNITQSCVHACCIVCLIQYILWHALYPWQELERHQSLCLRIIYPQVKSYTERLRLAKIPRINVVLQKACQTYAAAIIANTSHRLHWLVPPLQSARRHSSNLPEKRVTSSRTKLLEKSLFFSIT